MRLKITGGGETFRLRFLSFGEYKKTASLKDKRLKTKDKRQKTCSYFGGVRQLLITNYEPRIAYGIKFPKGSNPQFPQGSNCLWHQIHLEEQLSPIAQRVFCLKAQRSYVSFFQIGFAIKFSVSFAQILANMKLFTSLLAVLCLVQLGFSQSYSSDFLDGTIMFKLKNDPVQHNGYQKDKNDYSLIVDIAKYPEIAAVFEQMTVTQLE